MSDMEKLLKEVSIINKHYKHIAKITGENFNIFQILGIQSNEVRLHSAIIGELLNSKGSHGQEDKFLKLFISQLKDVFDTSLFDIESAKIKLEKDTGLITSDFLNGGRIDIEITDKNESRIIIENKIFASDQGKQIVRYSNYDTKAKLLYLNLFGNDPNKESYCHLVKGKDFYIISYKDNILQWIESCIKECAKLPILRETLIQYSQLIRQLTGKSIFKAMNEDIKDLLKKDKSYFESSIECINAYNGLINDLRNSFWEKCKKEKELFCTINGYEFTSLFGEDGDGFYFQFYVSKGDENVSRDGDTLRIREELLNISPYFVIQNGSGLGWINPGVFKGRKTIKSLDKDLLYDLLNSENRSKFIDEIIQETNGYKIKLKEYITSSSQ